MNRWIASLLLASGTAAQGQTLTLHFQERPPYSSARDDGSVVGLVADPAAAALARAGVAFRWSLTPSQRQLALIQSGSGLHCGIGWFRNDERAQLGVFSAPLYRDHAPAALMRDAIAPLDGRSTLDALFARRGLRLLVKEGYSYGPALDARIAALRPGPARTAADPLQMSRMLQSGRADWMIVAPEEAAVLGAAGLRLVTLTDLPDGPTRHLYCSADLPAEWLARIDRALAAPR